VGDGEGVLVQHSRESRIVAAWRAVRLTGAVRRGEAAEWRMGDEGAAIAVEMIQDLQPRLRVRLAEQVAHLRAAEPPEASLPRRRGVVASWGGGPARCHTRSL